MFGELFTAGFPCSAVLAGDALLEPWTEWKIAPLVWCSCSEFSYVYHKHLGSISLTDAATGVQSPVSCVSHGSQGEIFLEGRGWLDGVCEEVDGVLWFLLTMH